MIKKYLMPKYVRIPKDQGFLDILNGFEKVWGFPQCAGAIDGTHIPIIAPKEDHCDYYNRKGWHSIIPQAVVDYRYVFIDVNTGWPGSVHDARVLGNSNLYSQCEKGTCFSQPKTPIGGVDMSPFLIGDAAYPLLSWLMKPFRQTMETHDDIKHFNYRLSRARMVVENAFGRLKGRFRLLTAVTLHNICEMRKDTFEEDWMNNENSMTEIEVGTVNDLTDAKDIRNALVRHLKENPL
ncbi:protein ANTAGONIST OF LIKE HETEROCHROMATIN PROTEIN 1-like [Gigantopelta aegis]|uniref:protein ANTAGONIST OF LIKE HETEROCHROMATIN PROTEIN 1-like n=1 Tax=Gigantopelta aegis TaxID=1735272 RepID=UPI001B88A6C3|nr:protein ANTAGONIST OF LIKE HETEROCHROMATIN PROTEIN 1-like [Gigantopelta aegis]